MAEISQLQINGTTYDICDATARDSITQYLPLNAGPDYPLTASLYNQDNYNVVSSNLTDGTVADGVEGKRVQFLDSKNRTLGRINFWFKNNGVQTMRLLTQRNINGSNKYNILNLGVNSDGDAIVQLEGINTVYAWWQALQQEPYYRTKTALTDVNLTDPDATINAWHKIKASNASTLTGSPVTGDGPFIGVWKYFVITDVHGIAIIFEVYPTPGRIWTNVYNQTWKGWKSITPA